MGLGNFVKEGDELVDRNMPKLGKGFVVDFEVKSVGLKSGALTFGTNGVCAVASEKDADVHLVSFCFEPIEEALDAIPAVFLPKLFGLLKRG